MTAKTITKAQAAALRTAEPLEQPRTSPMFGRLLVAARPATLAVLARLGLAEVIGEEHYLTNAGETIRATLGTDGYLPRLDDVAYAVANTGPHPSAVIAEHHQYSTTWAMCPAGTRVSFLTGSSKTRDLLRHVGKVTAVEDSPVGDSGYAFRTYVITEDGTGAEHKINSGRVRALNDQSDPATAHVRTYCGLGSHYAVLVGFYKNVDNRPVYVCEEHRADAERWGATLEPLTELSNAVHLVREIQGAQDVTTAPQAAQEEPAPVTVYVTVKDTGSRIEYAHVPNGDPARVAAFLADANACRNYRDVSTDARVADECERVACNRSAQYIAAPYGTDERLCGWHSEFSPRTPIAQG